MTLTDMEQAVSEAEDTIRKSDMMATMMARLIRGRLKHVSSYVLKDLKRELQKFNAHTQTWSE